MLILFQYVERVTVMVFHAHRSQNGSHGPRRSALLSNYFANIRRRNAKAKNCIFRAFYGFNDYSIRLVDQGAGDFGHQLLHVVGPFIMHHCLAPLEDVGISLSGSRHSISIAAPEDSGAIHFFRPKIQTKSPVLGRVQRVRGKTFQIRWRLV
jgi:hypothetical protein